MDEKDYLGNDAHIDRPIIVFGAGSYSSNIEAYLVAKAQEEGLNLVLLKQDIYVKQDFIEQHARTTGQAIEDIEHQLISLAIKSKESEPLEIKNYRAAIPEALEKFRHPFRELVKVEHFENKNLGAKVGGRKHKKNPFTRRR